jgi:hypothetical protein
VGRHLAAVQADDVIIVRVQLVQPDVDAVLPLIVAFMHGIQSMRRGEYYRSCTVGTLPLFQVDFTSVPDLGLCSSRRPWD